MSYKGGPKVKNDYFIIFDIISFFFRETVHQERKNKDDISKECDTRLKSNLDTIQQLHQQVCIIIVLLARLNKGL